MKKLLVAALLLTFMCACGVGNTDFQSASSSSRTSSKSRYRSVLCIGNSISRHGPSPSIGWDGDWGMAATDLGKDYCHIVAGALGVPAVAINVAALERNPSDWSPLFTIPVTDPSTFVVVELGDNVAPSDLSAFEPVYLRLLQSVDPTVCTTTWWMSPETDHMIRRNCKFVGARVAFIGDIFTDPNNPDRLDALYSDDGVNRHPHDWSMAEIAKRILDAKPEPQLAN